jgi:hypothetical protein
MTNIDIATATKLDLLIADTQGQLKYTVLKPSRRGVKALTGQRAWANAAPKGSFMHGAIADAAAVTKNNKCSKAV